jgi:membrane-associated phospholipid phosphatase
VAEDSKTNANSPIVTLSAMSVGLSRAALWSVLAFAMNLSWEIGHVRLYTIWMEADFQTIAIAVFHCSFGDATIALVLYAIVGFALRRANWPTSRPWVGGAIVVAGALAYTTWSEWHNVYRTGAWGYAAEMPTVLGIGVSPLAQWSILPPLLVLAHRALSPVLAGQIRLFAASPFLQARLAPEGLYGLYLTIGATALFGAVWLFGGIAEDLITGDPLVAVDGLVSEWFRSHATPRITRGMQFVSALASATAVGIVFAVAACVLLWQRSWYRLSGLALAVGGGMLLNLLLKNIFGRARPGWADPLPTLADPGFPSGHTMMATITYGILAIWLILWIGSTRWRLLIAVAAILLVFLVALSRMYLGAHYLSDVLGAMAAATAWIALCLTSVESLRRRRN